MQNGKDNKRLKATAVAAAAAIILAAGFLVLVISGGPAHVLSSRSVPAANPASHFDSLPLGFEPNLGQASPAVKFVSQGAGYSAYLLGTQLVLAAEVTHARGESRFAVPTLTSRAATAPPAQGDVALFGFEFVGANPRPQVTAEEPLARVTNYIIGNQPQQWHTRVPNYAKVAYRSVYPGIDFVFYGARSRLEWDIEIRPGGNPEAVRFALSGAGSIKTDPGGDLVLGSGGHRLVVNKPKAYQNDADRRIDIDAAYKRLGPSTFGVEVANYDRSKPLIIDPAIGYSTYFGGAVSRVQSIAVDTSGNAYVAGWISTNDLPLGHPLQGSLSGKTNAFVAKISSDGSQLLYSTYLGSSLDASHSPSVDRAFGVAVDVLGNTYLTGDTNGVNFPQQNTSIRSSPGGGFDAFVTELSSDGSALVFSTYLGGSKDDAGNGIAVDTLGRVYVAGTTSSRNFQTNRAFEAGPPALPSGFLTKIVIDAGSAVTAYSTYLGGSSSSTMQGVAVDQDDNAYVVGSSGSGFPVTTSAHFSGLTDAVVARLNTLRAGAASLVYATYLGGSSEDLGEAISLDPGCTDTCSAYVTGATFSGDFPVTSSAAFGGLADAFVAKFDPSGKSLYATYLGGSGIDLGEGIAVDSSGQAWVTGLTASSDFPGGSVQPPPNGVLFISTDGGATFSRSGWPSQSGSITLNAFSHEGPPLASGSQPLFAGTDRNGILTSTDGGQSFSPLAASLVLGHTRALTFASRLTPPQLLVGTTQGLFSSTDGGASFAAVSGFPAGLSVLWLGHGTHSNQAIFVGTNDGFFTSTDGAKTFAKASGVPSRSQVFSGATDQSTGAIYLGTDRGVFQSTDGGASFAATVVNFVPVLSVETDPTTSPSTQYAGTFGSGLLTSTSGFVQSCIFFFGSLICSGAQVQVGGISQPNSTVFALRADELTFNPETLYAGIGSLGVGALLASSDGGATFAEVSAVGDRPGGALPIDIDAKLPASTVYAGFAEEQDAFIAQVSSDGSKLLFSSYLGGGNVDAGQAVAVDSQNLYVAGTTFSSDFPTTCGSVQAGFPISGFVTGFVAKFPFAVPGGPPVFPTPCPPAPTAAPAATPTATVTATATATATPTPVIGTVTLSPAPLSFGKVKVNKTLTKSVKVLAAKSNKVPVIIVSFSTNAGDYTVNQSPRKTTCTQGGVLKANKSCNIAITFQPSSKTASDTGALQVQTNASTIKPPGGTVTLKGGGS